MRKFAVILISLLFLLSLTGCSGIKMKKGAEDYIGSHYEKVVDELNQLGFQDIETIELPDLTSFSEMDDGAVSEVSFDGTTDFTAKTRFTKDTPIVITYHIIKKLPSPITNDQIASMNYAEIAEAFTNAGFTNVQITEAYDLDPDETTADHQNEVTVNHFPLPEDSDELPFDAAITVICHYPYQKYDVSLKIDFIRNLFFSKYAVVFSIDGLQQAILSHGTDWEGKLRLSEGTHELLFAKESDSSVNGSTTLKITGDIEAVYKISCYNDKVTVDTISLNNLLANSKSDPSPSDEADSTHIKQETGANSELEKETDNNRNTKNELKEEIPADNHDNQEYNLKNETENETSPEIDKAIMEEIVMNQACSTVRNQLQDLEYTAEYEHEYTHMDFTGEIEYHSDEELDDLGFIVTGIKQLNQKQKTIVLYVNTTDNIDRIKSQKELQKTLEQNFDPAVALATLEQYGKTQYPQGFRISMITGRLAETPVDENTWFMKYICKVTDFSGKQVEMTCEAKIKGPESNPTVYDFNVY